MNDSTPQRTSPKEETLQFLRMFARIYRPFDDNASDTTNNNTEYHTFNTALC